MRIAKIDIIKTAYEHLRISGITVNASPEDIVLALDILESMMAELNSRNICPDYRFSEDGDPNDDAGVELWAKHGIATNLAVRLIPAFGKQPNPVLAMQANQSMSNLSARSAQVREAPHSNRMPRGSGNTLRYNRWRRFYREPVVAPNDCSTITLKVGEINDYTERYQDYLNDNEDIDTYTIETSEALNVISSGNTFTDISYRVEALDPGDTGTALQILRIKMTTTNGRIEEREINFNVI